MIKEYGYEYDAVLNETVWLRTQGKVTNQTFMNALCLRSGRDALKAIAREYEPSIVLVPALSCDSMIRPFEQYGHRIKYYKLNSDYSIDLKSLEIDAKRVLFLYMDYFGRQSISDTKLVELRNRKDIIFIEDRTHNLIWEKKSTFNPDYVIASLRKWLPIPDGGLLWGSINKSLASNVSFSAIRLKAQCMRHEFLACGDEKIKQKYRKIFSTVSDIMDSDEPSAMSAYAYNLVKDTDWEKVCAVRKANARTMIAELQCSPHVTFIQENVGLSDLYVPFVVPNRDEVQRRLSAKGIFNTIIWPLTYEQKCVCGVAKNTEENMLAAPCDQRYTEEDMKFVGEEIVRVISDVNG